jgi:hypothetical protein
MAMKVSRVDTWAASITDEPGGLAPKLAALREAGVNLEFVIARRSPEVKKGTAVVFVTPIKGAAQIRAARKVGFKRATSLHAVRVEGPDKKGQGAAITAALADAGLNLRGLSAAAIGRRFVAHVALDKAADATKAARLLRSL